MLPAPPHQQQRLYSLGVQTVKNVFSHGFMCRLAKIDVPVTEANVFGRRAEWRSWNQQDVHTVTVA